MGEKKVVFVEAVRTPFGRLGGALKDIYASKLAGIGIRGLLDKSKINERYRVDTVMLGSAAHCSRALNPARWALLEAGLGFDTSASYVEMQCGSAIDAINHCAWKILAGQAEVTIAGGMESSSQLPAKFSMSQPPYRMMPPRAIEQALGPIAEGRVPMAETAENLQKMYDIPREAQDEFAFNSQMRAKAAWENNYFKDEIVPVTFPATRKTPETVFDRDEHIRPETTLEKLAKLPPAFRKDGTITAGNASGLNDGAAFVLMMSAEKAEALGYTPMARWLAGADYGVNPKIMGIAPAYTMADLLKQEGLGISDIDVIECNEAFAVQNLAVIKELENLTGDKVDMAVWNPNGGAIAYGHPNGASGARISMFAMRELERRGGRYGLCATCCGGGLGVATLIENLRR